ncbi:MAG: phytoene desaturase [Anaerolineae bacterium]
MAHIIVIGSGFGGLGAAIRLAARGHDVEIYEKRDKLGGRAYAYEINGFKFDGGPTVITVPSMFDDIWKAAGRNREDYFEMLPVNPFYRIFNHKREHFEYNNDEEHILNEIARFNPDDRDGYLRFMTTARAIFEKGFVQLADQPFLQFSDMLKVAPDLIKLQSYLSVYQYVSKFIKDDFLRRVFTFHPLLIGGNPFDASSIYAMIHHIEREWGIYYAKGGTGAAIEAMGRLFEDVGGKIHLNAEISEITVDPDDTRRVTGVRMGDGSLVKADIVVSNADAAFTYRNMIAPEYRKKYTDKKIDSLKYSMSLFVIYFGTKRQYRDQGLAHHNIILSERYKGLLNDIFKKKVLADDFSLYLHIPTMTDPSMAPPGHETFYVLSPVPHLGADIDWATTAKLYRDRIMQFLEENYLPDLQENIVVEHMIDPRHFKNTLNSHMGAAFSVQPILLQSAWFRPHNQSEDFDNLYFVGAGTHPGAGLPGVLSSSIIADKLIAEVEPDPGRVSSTPAQQAEYA